MALDFHISKEQFETTAPEMREHYREVVDGPSKGMYRLQFNGQSPIAEFRDTNARLMRELTQATERAATAEAKVAAQEEVLAKYRDEDGNPLDADEMKRVRAQLAEKGGKKGAGVEEVIATSLKPLQATIASLQKALEDQKTQTETERKNAKRARLQSALLAQLDPVLVPGTAPFVVRDMLDDFDIGDDDEPTPKKHDAEGNPVTTQRYLDALRQRTPGIFRQSTSGEEKDTGTRMKVRGDGVRELHNPTSIEMGQYAKEIGEGKIKVVRSR